jgi:hypothetical protein
MRKKKQFLMATLCAFSMTVNSAAVLAQVKEKKQEPKPGVEQAPGVTTFTLPAPPNQFTFIQSEFSFGGPVVKGAPYSAEAVTETIQTLGDGNRIIQNYSSKIYRDSEGRTRHEQALKAIGPWAVSGEAPVMISINDPVSGVHYSLNSNTKTANKAATLQKIGLEAALTAKMRDRLKAGDVAESGGVSATATFGTVTSSSTRAIVNAPSVAPPPPGRIAVARDVNTFVGQMAPGVPVATANGVFSWTGEGEVNMESLGKQTIEGVEAEGQRVTVTIQAGKIGNERPIVTVNERWYSPELQTVVLSKNSDPRIGETTYKLINIDRSEPDTSLFQVPADYTVEEGPSFNVGAPVAPTLQLQRKRKPNEN